MTPENIQFHQERYGRLYRTIWDVLKQQGFEGDGVGLDVGCCTGGWSAPWTRMMRHVVGYDPDESAVEEARKLLYGQNFTGHCDRIPEHQYSHVLLVATLFVVPPATALDLLEKISSVMAPGSKILVNWPRWPLRMGWVLRGTQHRQGWRHMVRLGIDILHDLVVRDREIRAGRRRPYSNNLESMTRTMGRYGIVLAPVVRTEAILELERHHYGGDQVGPWAAWEWAVGVKV